MIVGAPVGDLHLDVHAPFNDQLLSRVEMVDWASVERALDTARTLFRDRSRWLSPARRMEILATTAVLMEQQAEDLALVAAREGGKPLMDSRVEVQRAIDGVKSCVEILRTDTPVPPPMNLNAASAQRLALVTREPIGPVLAISAFNHPLNLIVHQVAPALAAGCPVLVKPAEDTPRSCFRFVSLLREAGLPEEWCQAFLCDKQVTGRLVEDARLGFLSFIGSAAVGWMLRAKLAPGTRCALEHGGVAPVIVAPDADLQDTLPRLIKGGFYHAGQVCVSVQRIFAHESMAFSLSESLAQQARCLVVGDPTQPETEIGPLIRKKELQRVHEWVTEAINGGAMCLTGGTPVSSSCYAPTVLFNPPQKAQVSTREIFGPVVCVYPYGELDEAIARANSLPFAFQAAVFTRQLDVAMQASRTLDASAVMINDHTAFRVDWMPFAGLRQSGLGVGGILHTFREMQIEKMIVIRSPKL
ncbi:MAG: aldehyde dehydrogenase family protein [Magnetococcales bacterium]|nr:aldehyde dehydrogenase family protein [Magnetococcales bacterium]MBF0349130.1 aldehyde dehydrogenase family protein [Magnetococcales bacterium]